MNAENSPENELNVPCEILMVIFELLDLESLYNCMFVSRKWSEIAQKVADHQRLWQPIVKKYVINKGEQFEIKSRYLTWKNIMERSLMWYHCDKAKIDLNKTYLFDNIKKINLYRDHLIIVCCLYVRYLDIKTSEIIKEIEATCFDFNENDDIILKAERSRDCYKKVYLFGKETPAHFNMEKNNEISVDRVMHYRLENNKCYVLDTRNILTLYIWRDRDWELKFVSRYYGDPEITAAMNVYDDESYILLKSGTILWANLSKMGFQKELNITMPVSDTDMSIYTKMFHKFGFVFGVNRNKKFSFNSSYIHESQVYIMECPDLSCVTQHAEVLFLGYNDGKVEFIVPRDPNKDGVIKRVIHIKDLIDLDNTRVVSIDVHEGKDHQDLFIATHSEILHLVITHPNSDDYLFSRIPLYVPQP